MPKKGKSDKKKRGKIKIDFSDVKGGKKTVPDDDYSLVVKDAWEDQSEAGNDMIVTEMEISEGKHKGYSTRYYLALTENALWKVRGFFEAIGMDIGDGETSYSVKKLVGATCAGTLEAETRDGTRRSKLQDVFPLDELDQGDDEDDEEDEEIEDDDDEDDDDDEADDEEEEDEDDEDDEPPKKKRKKGKGRK